MTTYDKYKKENQKKYWKKILPLWLASKGRTGRQRPRSAFEEQKLIEFDKIKMLRMIKSKELISLGSRKFRLKLINF